MLENIKADNEAAEKEFCSGALRTEELGGDVRVLVSKKHGFGTDALLLAHFAAPKNVDRVCDLGTGCGIIPLYWRSRGVSSYICALDIQQSAYDQLCLSLELNAPDKAVVPVLSDIRSLKGVLPFGEFDLVTMNPPYFKAGAGIISRDSHNATARHSLECTLEDVFKAAALLLRFGGRLCICIPPDRLCDAFCAMRPHGLEPKRLRLVKHKAHDRPYLALIEAKRGGKPSLLVQEDFVLKGSDGSESQALCEVLSEYLKMKSRNKDKGAIG